MVSDYLLKRCLFVWFLGIWLGHHDVLDACALIVSTVTLAHVLRYALALVLLALSDRDWETKRTSTFLTSNH